MRIGRTQFAERIQEYILMCQIDSENTNDDTYYTRKEYYGKYMDRD